MVLCTNGQAYAQGQRDLSPGLNYTTIKPQDDNIQRTDSVTTQRKSEKGGNNAASEVWEKYQSLATGQAGNDEVSEEPSAPAVDTAGKPSAPAQGKPMGVGLNSLLQKWRENKDQQKEMRSKSFGVPKTLEPKPPKSPAKPTVSKPTTPATAEDVADE